MVSVGNATQASACALFGHAFASVNERRIHVTQRDLKTGRARGGNWVCRNGKACRKRATKREG